MSLNKNVPRFFFCVFLVSCGIVALKTVIQPSHAQSFSSDWYTAGANSQRTSWVDGGITQTNNIKVEWSLPINNYIPQRVQLIAVNGVLYLATANGIIAIQANNHTKLWDFATSAPVMHSPTVANGKIYFGSMDRKLYALNINNGSLACSFTGGAGFSTNPLYVDDGNTKRIYAGNRDGKMYVLDANCNGSTLPLVAAHQTNGYIDYSAAWGGSGDNTIYFASNDSRAYAINNSGNTSLKWQSAVLPGQGMYSWWPVPGPNNTIIFTTTVGYKGKMMGVIRDSLLVNNAEHGYTIGDILGNGSEMPYMDVTTVSSAGGLRSITDYFEENPKQRTVLVLNRSNGNEKTYNFDNDGNPDYAPLPWGGMTGSLNRHPPALGPDGVFYIRTAFVSDGNIPSGPVVGWQEGSKYLLLVQSREQKGFGDWPIDEPGIISGSGNIAYHVHCCDRVLSAFNITMPNIASNNDGQLTIDTVANRLSTLTLTSGVSRQWRFADSMWNAGWFNSNYYDYILQYNGIGDIGPNSVHTDVSPLVPHQGKLYTVVGNAVVALSQNATPPTQSLPSISISSPPQSAVIKSPAELSTLLNQEIQKLLSVQANGKHLQAGFFSIGLQDLSLEQIEANHLDLYRTPGENLYILLRAYEQVTGTVKTNLKSFIKYEYGFSGYNTPQSISFLGYDNADQSRSVFMSPLYYDNPPSPSYPFTDGTPPARKSGTDVFAAYALYKYAQTFNGDGDVNPGQIWTAIKPKLTHPISTAVSDTFSYRPDLHNKYIAAYIGYIGLASMAGDTMGAGGVPISSYQAGLTALLNDRVNTLTHQLDASMLTGNRIRSYYTNLVGWNFMWLVPELFEQLSTPQKNLLKNKVQLAVNSYSTTAPYWFIGRNTENLGEGVLSSPYDTNMLQAIAWILGEPYSQIQKYVDAPMYAVGDMYYINNLVTALESPDVPPTPTPDPNAILGDIDGDGDVDVEDMLLLAAAFGTSNPSADLNFDGKVNSIDFQILYADFGH